MIGPADFIAKAPGFQIFEELPVARHVPLRVMRLRRIALKQQELPLQGLSGNAAIERTVDVGSRFNPWVSIHRNRSGGATKRVPNDANVVEVQTLEEHCP